MKKFTKGALTAALVTAMASSCSSDDDSGSSSSSTNDFTPTSLTVSLPTTLTSESSSSSLKLQSGTPGTGESQGYSEVTEKVRRIQFQMADLSLNNSLLDQVFSQDCGGALTDGSCTVTNACVTLTSDMVSVVKGSMGDEHFETDGELAYMDQLVGQEYCLPSVSITALTDNSEGYNFQAVIVEDDTNNTTQLWNTDRTRVKIIEEYQDDFSGGGPALNSSLLFKGASVFIYDSSTQTFKAKNTFSFTSGSTTQQGEENFTIQSLSDKLDVNGIIIKGSIKSEFNGNTWGLDIEGKVDNNGGFIRTQSSWTNYTVSAISLSAACTANKQYGFFPSGSTTSTLTGDKIYQDQIGSLYCFTATASPDATYAYIYNQLPSNPSSMVLMEIAYPEIPTDSSTDFYPTLTASSITISSLTASPSTDYHCYEEEFSATGELSAWRAADQKCDTANLSWDQETGSFGTEYAYDESTDGANFQGIDVTISGASEADLKTASSLSDYLPQIFITASGADLSSQTPHTPEFDKLLIGIGWPIDPAATAASSGVANYDIEYWGTSDQVSSAEVWVESINETTGAISVTKVSSASVAEQ